MNPASRVSIALSTHDGERHVAAQLDSIAQQTLLPAELVVHDDGSCDGTVAILERFHDSAPFPVNVTTGPRIGFGASLADVLDRCEGELIAPCDQDDLWLPHKLQALVDALDGRRDTAAAVCNGLLIDERGDPQAGSTFAALGFTRARRRQFAEDPVPLLCFRSVVSGHALLVRGTVVKAALPFPEPVSAPGPLGPFPDRWLSLIAAGQGRIAVVEDQLVRHRQHAQQQTGVDARVAVRAKREAGRWQGQLRNSGGDFAERLSERADLPRMRPEGLTTLR